MTGCIVGWAHTPFGRLEGETVESLIVRVANGALADAGIEARDVDEIVLGHFNAGFSAQDFTAALVLLWVLAAPGVFAGLLMVLIILNPPRWN